MPSGKVHELLDLLLGLGLAYFFYSKHYPLDISIKLFIGAAILPLYFSNDLDIWSRALKRWGLLKFIFMPYVKAGHREILHNHLWSPVILSTIPALLMLPYIWKTHDSSILWVLIGLAAASEWHIMVDYLISDEKKIVRGKF